MRMNSSITQERLRELLSYCPEAGQFTWIKPTTRRVSVGDKAGTTDAGGYVVIKIDGTLYKAHRLAWLYETGRMPAHFTDHINGIRSDNRICNLREADSTLNAQNTRKARKDNKSSKFLGVSLEKGSGKWIASIATDGKPSKKIGRFSTEAEAAAAYVEAKRSFHLGCSI